MIVRIKFAKYDTLKFIGHLDLMRFMQKAVRRAGLNIAYSGGFSPHQIMSFAAPLGIGQTSEGEYFDAEFHTVPDMEEFCALLNAEMTEGMRILGATVLPERGQNEKKETAMALVAASDYLVLKKDGYDSPYSKEELQEKFSAFLAQDTIIALKKSKKTEREIDLKQFIYGASAEGTPTGFSGSYENGICFYLLLSTGSVNNIKPETVMEAFFTFMGQPYNPNAWQVHRLETYADLALCGLNQGKAAELSAAGARPERCLVPLLKYKELRK